MAGNFRDLPLPPPSQEGVNEIGFVLMIGFSPRRTFCPAGVYPAILYKLRGQLSAAMEMTGGGFFFVRILLEGDFLICDYEKIFCDNDSDIRMCYAYKRRGADT